MLGRQHLAITLATIGGLATPFYYLNPVITSALILGAAVGTLIPDIDQKNSLIFQRKIARGSGAPVRLANVSGVLFPIFGYLTRYTVYLPSVFLLRLLLPKRYEPDYGHRLYMHSLLGLITTTAITAAYIIVFITFFSSLDRLKIIILTSFLIGYFSGGFLHLLEDACTKSGVKFFYPFSKCKIKGGLKTGEDRLKPYVLALSLSGVAVLALYLSYFGEFQTGFYTGLGLVVALWSFFLIIVNAELSY